jgi:LysM repeat protein
VDTNLPPQAATNALPPIPTAMTPQAPVAPPQVDTPAAGTEYVVVAGDTLAKIAKAHGVTLKALENANPGVDPKKLKPKQKLVIPAATAAAAMGSTGAAPMAATDAGGESYVVKSGDNLSKIAKKHGVSVKALKAANNMSTDHIKVGEKLKIPAKAEAAAPAAPTTDTSAAPVLPPVSTPAPVTPAPTPAPGH